MTGRDFEIYLAQTFEKLGYKVILHKGTKDYGVDLIIQKNFQKIAIQAKRYKNKVNLKAVQEAFSGKDYYNCNKCMVITNSYFQKSAIELASKVNCKLIDRDELIYIKKSFNKNMHITKSIIFFIICYIFKQII